MAGACRRAPTTARPLRRVVLSTPSLPARGRASSPACSTARSSTRTTTRSSSRGRAAGASGSSRTRRAAGLPPPRGRARRADAGRPRTISGAPFVVVDPLARLTSFEREPRGGRPRASATICSTVSRTAWSASESGDAFGEMSASRRGGRSAIVKITHRRELGRDRGLGQHRHPGARGDEVGDEPDALDLDRDGQRARRAPAPPARSRCAAGCPPAAARAACSASASNGTGSGGSSVPGGASPTSASSSRCSTASRSSRTGSVTTACASSSVEHLGEQALRRALVHAQLDPRRALAEVGDERGDEPPARGADDAEAGVGRPGAPGARRRPRGAARARAGSGGRGSSTTCPDSVGVAPERPRASSVTPSSASSWRTCSETFDWTVRRMSAAAVNVPSSSIAISVSRCRSSMAALLLPPAGPVPGGRWTRSVGIALSDRTYQSNLLDRSGP